MLRIIMTFEYENLLLLKSPQNNWHQILWSLKKHRRSDISYMPGALWDKVIDLADEPLVQCDVPTAKNILLDDDNDDCK